MKFKDYKIRLGYAPTRRNGGGPDPAPSWIIRDKLRTRIEEILKNIHDVELVDIDWINEEKLLYSNADAYKVADYFIEKKVDAIFMPSCNYGCEEVCSIVGKAVNKPFLLWAPRDDAPTNDIYFRDYDFQCGLFTIGNVLLRTGVPFTYIENCWMDSPILDEGIENFIRVASVVKAFNNLVVGTIGMRPQPFLCVMYNEGELLEKFGIRVVPVEGTDIIQKMHNILDTKSDLVDKEVARINNDVDTSLAKNDVVRNTAALEIAIRELCDEFQCSAFATECWKVIVDEFKIWPCYAVGDLSDEGIVLGCETDLLGTISSVIMAAAARGETSSFIADLTIRHPTNDNAELIWHCGPFPKSLCKVGTKPKLVDEGFGRFEINGGDITIGRLGYHEGKYTFLLEELKGVDGPKTNGTYVWAEAKDWPKLERKIVCGPYLHHVSGVHGKYADIIAEALKYVNIEADRD